MLKFHQVTEEFIDNLLKQCTLGYSSRREEEVDLFPQTWVVFIQVEQDCVYFIVIECQYFVKGLYAVESANPDIIDLIV